VASTKPIAAAGPFSEKPGSPPERPALDGHCPVTMVELARMKKGSASYTATWQGQTYHFTSAENRDKFLRSPETFLPAESGSCVVTWALKQQRAPGAIQFPALFGNQLYLFCDEECRRLFLEDPDRYVGAGKVIRAAEQPGASSKVR
jgi:YHS domain-containing protein